MTDTDQFWDSYYNMVDELCEEWNLVQSVIREVYSNEDMSIERIELPKNKNEFFFEIIWGDYEDLDRPLRTHMTRIFSTADKIEDIYDTLKNLIIM